MAQRIAVVEDEADIRDALALALRREGYDVEVYADGADALLGFRQRVPDLVLLDWMLPGMSGMDLLRVLRADSRFAACAVVIVDPNRPIRFNRQPNVGAVRELPHPERFALAVCEGRLGLFAERLHLGIEHGALLRLQPLQ